MAKSTYLFLDERGAEVERFYFLGGVALSAEGVREVASWVRAFKRTLRPEVDADSWYLKGSGEWVYHGVKNAELREEAFRRWELWADHLEELRVAYRVHATLVLPDKFLASPDNKLVGRKERRAAVLQAGMLATLLSLEPHEPGSITLWIDRVEGAQGDALKWGTSYMNDVARQHGLSISINSVSEVPKSDTSSDESQILQLVDMHIYALSRFILPSAPEFFILANFERLLYASTSNEMPAFLAGSGDAAPDVLASRYYKISSIYHHLRHRIAKNIFTGTGKPVSSMILVGGTTHLNFGHDVDAALWRFCNPMWEGWSRKQLLMDLEAYE